MFKRCTHLALALLAFTLVAVQAQTTRETEWWESASLYQIYPRSFQDTDGNGIGDLKGITQRLPYLKEIGITATWLSPIWKSPMSDFGYDISDYFMVDPIFGTMEDFDAMMEEARRIGMRIILDFVPNHTSDECEWFQKSIKREPGYEDFYVWNDGRVDPNDPSKRLPPSNWVSVFGGPMWTWVEERGQYYLHQFQDKQPDLNYTNPLVRTQMLEVLEFWLDKGVAGFRLDATPHIFEAINDDGTYNDEPVSGWSNDPNDYTYHEHIYTKDQYPTIELMYEWRDFIDKYQAKNGGEVRVLLAEAFSPIEILDQYFGNGTHMGTQLPMNFNLMYLSSQANARDIEGSCNYWMDTMWKIHQTANWVIGNHDNGRVKNRVGKEKVDAWNFIVNSLPGASITYYGEEIGMSDVPIISNEDRDPERTPMQWSPSRMAGFTDGDSTWLPIAEDYRTFNVETERGVARSTLQLFKGLQALKQTAAFKAVKQPGGFSYGALTDQVFQIVRSANNVEEYRTLVNLGDKIEKLHNISDKTMEYVLMNSYSPHVKGEKVDLRDTLYLMPYESIVLRWAPL